MSSTASSPGALEWRDTDEGLRAVYVDERGRERDVTWTPQPGSQQAFLACPVREVLLEGNRGGGKTDSILMAFGMHVGRGYGEHWRGVIFRRHYLDLQDLIAKSGRWFPRIWPNARFIKGGPPRWVWPGGEMLALRQFEGPDDYWKYHGHEYPFIGWEELTNWATPECLRLMFSCNRSSRPGIPLMVRSTTNPYGVGHNWVKARYRLPLAPGRVAGRVITDARNPEGDLELPRVAIRSSMDENRVLLNADPNYMQTILANAPNPAARRAWASGDWNIVAGGMFDDLWNPSVHVVPNFPIHMVPRGWHLDRSYDHGQSAPFSVGWWAESNGEPFEYQGVTYGHCPGDLYRVAEWYGWKKDVPNEGLNMASAKIARGILERERDWGISGRVQKGPADSSIFDDYEPQKSVAKEMAREGVHWLRVRKGPGSRVQGWQQCRKYLENALVAGPLREAPGCFVLQRCEQGFLRTVPVLPRSDKDLDDVDTNSEDHPGDEWRYKLRHTRRVIHMGEA